MTSMVTPLEMLTTAQPAQGLRFFHCSDSKLCPGDRLVPTAQMTPEQWQSRPHHAHENVNLRFSFYDASGVYVWDERMVAHSDDPGGFQTYMDMDHMYEVQPQGALVADPERKAMLDLFNAGHNHTYTGNIYDYHQGCPACADGADEGFVDGPEWYHPFLWMTTGAIVLSVLDEAGLNALRTPQQRQWLKREKQREAERCHARKQYLYA